MNERQRPRSGGFISQVGTHRTHRLPVGDTPIGVRKNGSLLKPIVEFASPASALAGNQAEFLAAN